jgi:hypothetical protein
MRPAQQAMLAVVTQAPAAARDRSALDLRSWPHGEPVGAMARVLIVGGEDRAATLAEALLDDGYAVRVVLDPLSAARGAPPGSVELAAGDPDRPGTLKPALEHVAVACWLFGSAPGGEDRVGALHGARLERFLHQTIDSSVRGLLYEATGSLDAALLGGGREIVTGFADAHAIPLALVTADPSDRARWREQAREALGALMRSPGPRYAENTLKSDRVLP